MSTSQVTVWSIIAVLAVIALAPVIVQAARAYRRRHAESLSLLRMDFASAEEAEAFEEHWRTITRDAR